MRAQVCAVKPMNHQAQTLCHRSDIVDKTLEALLSAAVNRKATPASELKFKEFALALVTLEILGLARSIANDEGIRSWFATDELEWLASRDHVVF